MTRACWSCGAAGVDDGALTCPTCNAVQPPGQASPFTRLGVEPRFDLDDKALERAWLDRSRKVHPDRFGQKSDAERRYAAEQTAALNDAYRAVKDPFDRASVIVAAALGRARAPGADPAATTAKLDQALLLQLMEAREQAEESAADKARVVDESRARYAALLRELGALLGAGDALDDKRAQKAARMLAEMKTLARLVDDLGGGKLIAGLSDR